MARKKGRTDVAGNKKSESGKIHIGMKNPNIHLMLQKKKG